MYTGIFLLSAATLLLEITLTRVFSVTQGHHFAFMAVSLALLGFGASGTALAILPRLLRWDARLVLAGASLSFAIASVGGFYATNALPFDAYSVVWNSQQLLYLAAYYLVLAVPFFFTGVAVGAGLAKAPSRAGAFYGFSLVGSSVGCLSSLGGPPLLGASGTVIAVGLLGLCSAGAFMWGRFRWAAAAGPVAAVALTALLAAVYGVPGLKISPYKGISHALRPAEASSVWSRWNPFALVEVVDSPNLHMAPGLSFAYKGELPAQMAISVDGDNLNAIVDSLPQDAEFTRFLPSSLVYGLTTDPRVLLVEPQGGMDLLTALHHDAASVVTVTSNPLVFHAVAERYASRAGRIFGDPRVRSVIGGTRSYLRGTDEKFDVVQLSLSDSFRPVLAGAYSISESYLYTSEAFQEYYRHLETDGFVSVTRWIQVPPSEGVRVVSVAIEALEREGVDKPEEHLAVVRSLQTMTLLVKKSALTAEDKAAIGEFSRRLQYDLVYYPSIHPSELNRFSVHPSPVYHEVVSAMLSETDAADLYRRHPYDLSPVTDDRPFYFHLFKWSQTAEVVGNLGKTFRPFGGAGFLILLGILVVAVMASAAFILLPLVVSRPPSAAGEEIEPPLPSTKLRGWRPFVYFAALGLGFLWIEIPLLQRFILYLDQPTYSFATVLFAVLFWSGVGSLTSRRLGRRRLLAVPATAVLALTYAWALTPMFDATLGLPLGVRMVIAVASLAPLAFAMGVPFPSGIGLLGERAPRLVPWAWAVNGSMSVISAILATLLALSFGFTWVMAGAGVAYLAASGAVYGVKHEA